VDALENAVEAAKQKTAQVLGSQIEVLEQYYAACLDLFIQVHADREEHDGGDPIMPLTLKSFTDKFRSKTITDHWKAILCSRMEKQIDAVADWEVSEQRNLAAAAIEVATTLLPHEKEIVEVCSADGADDLCLTTLLPHEEEIFDSFLGRLATADLRRIIDMAKQVADVELLKVPNVERILPSPGVLLSGMSDGKSALRWIGKTAQAEACQRALRVKDTGLVAAAMVIGSQTSISEAERKVRLRDLFLYS
jgi:hypothetical protein